MKCGSCGNTELRPTAKFCDECGTPTMPTTPADEAAEYKQVTVLFADVVRSMDIAAAVDPERLRDIMSELLSRSNEVVRRHGGIVDKFTGDGVMALFGAPVALEDHAVRACLAALDVQREAATLAEEVKRRDALTLQLRVGLNSGRVIAGAVGAGPWSYTALGEQVGMAQRMESAAPPGGAMLSESTARLVEHCANLVETQLVRIKGRQDPVAARQLLGIGSRSIDRTEGRFVGRHWEMAALDSMMQRAIQGRGGVVRLVGPAGIGKGRLAREVALITRIVRQRTEPTLYILEHAHWSDAASQAMLADIATVLPRTRSVLLITHRSEDRGALSRIADAQCIVLGPLNDSDAAALMVELLGTDPTVAGVGAMITARASGNPFFAEEIVRDLRDRGVLQGQPGDYVCTASITDISVPATVHAAIAARIDRLSASAKRTLRAAAVIGDRFNTDLLASLSADPAIEDLIDADFINEVATRRAHLAILGLSPSQEYAFRQQLIRVVAYESLLRSARADLHRRLAALIQTGDPVAAQASAERVAEHLEAAGDLHEAYAWHMRAGTWWTKRDIGAARRSWQRAREVADRLAAGEADVIPMRIAPRAQLCATAWLAGANVADTDFDELRDLCDQVSDKVSLAMGMGGQVMARTFHNEIRDASRLATDYIELLESIGNPTVTVGAAPPAIVAKCEAGEMVEALRLGQRVVQLAAGDATRGDAFAGSPLAVASAMCSFVKCCLGISGCGRKPTRR